MADRFPSLDEIDAGMYRPCFIQTAATNAIDVGQTETRGEPTIESVNTNDSTSDFLARERAVLGDDANLFENTEGGNDASAVGADVDLLEGSGHEQHIQDTSAITPGSGDMGAFESSFPAIDSQNEVLPMRWAY